MEYHNESVDEHLQENVETKSTIMTWAELVESEIGYKPFTTFWQDFTIADAFGEKAIQDTYNRAFKEWRTDYRYLTEFVMVLNHKASFHYRNRDELSRLYSKLYDEADAWACDHLKGEELSFYLRTLD